MTYAQALYIKKMPHLKMARDLANLCKCDLHYKIKVDKRWRLIVYTIIDSDRWFQLALIYRRISISIEQMFWIRTSERFPKCKMPFRIIYYFFRPPSIIKKMPHQNKPRDKLSLFHMLFTFPNDLTTILFQE